MKARDYAAYGAGELGPAMAGSTMVFFQMVFLTDVAGMAPSMAGGVLLIARVWDAMNDPLIGWLSDHTNSRLGRRLPWMLACAAPFAIFFAAFWFVPPAAAQPDAQWTKFFYYSAAALLYSAASTGFALPHTALTAEISRDYDERSRLTAARMGFSLGGSVGGLLVALLVFKILDGALPALRYATFGVSVAIIGLVAALACIAGIWRFAPRTRPPQLHHASPHHPFREHLLPILRNRAFLVVCGVYLCSWLAMQFTAGVLPYYTRVVMGLPAQTFQLLALTVQSVALLLLPLWTRASIATGKKTVYLAGMSFWLVAQGGLFFIGPHHVGLLYLMAVLAGIGISVCYLIPSAMLPDVIEWDELKTGRRREGIYYGFCVFLQKLALAAGAFVTGQILSHAGYVPTGPGEEAAAQPEAVLGAIRWAIGPVPSAVLAIGMLLAALYPITRARHARMVALLRRKAGRERQK